jgi:hypothetical protein
MTCTSGDVSRINGLLPLSCHHMTPYGRLKYDVSDMMCSKHGRREQRAEAADEPRWQPAADSYSTPLQAKCKTAQLK